MQERNEEIQNNLARERLDRAYAKIRSLQAKQKTRTNVSKTGDMLFEIEEVDERWKKYIVELYNGEDIMNNRQYIEAESNVDRDMLDLCYLGQYSEKLT